MDLEMIKLIIGSGGVFGIAYLIFKSGKFFGKFDDFSAKIMLDISDLKKDVRSIDQRISRLEGAFEERGRWEPHVVKNNKAKQFTS